MPCNNCQKIISQVEIDPRDEKEIIKGLVNCKECSDEIVNRCHTCYWPIYKKELVYESSFNSSLKGNFWIWTIKSVFKMDGTQTVVQCEWCYQQWQTELKKQKEELDKSDWWLHILFSFIAFFLFTLFWWDLMKEAFNYPPTLNPFIAIIASLSLWFFIWRIIKKAPKADRYKPRNRKPKPKK